MLHIEKNLQKQRQLPFSDQRWLGRGAERCGGRDSGRCRWPRSCANSCPRSALHLPPVPHALQLKCHSPGSFLRSFFPFWCGIVAPWAPFLCSLTLSQELECYKLMLEETAWQGRKYTLMALIKSHISLWENVIYHPCLAAGAIPRLSVATRSIIFIMMSETFPVTENAWFLLSHFFSQMKTPWTSPPACCGRGLKTPKISPAEFAS